MPVADAPKEAIRSGPIVPPAWPATRPGEEGLKDFFNSVPARTTAAGPPVSKSPEAIRDEICRGIAAFLRFLRSVHHPEAKFDNP